MQFTELPDDPPIPEDDRAADHLLGGPVPDLTLRSTGADGETNLATAAAGALVAYVYPMTGTPGRPVPTGWTTIPGAFGCTAESCAFRDHAAELSRLGATVVGVSAQDAGEQRAFAERERIPYPLLNDADFKLARVLDLPTFEVDGRRFYRRLTFIAREGRIERVFYPVFPPDRHPAEVVSWLEGDRRSG